MLDSKMMAIRAFTSTDYFRQLLYKVKGFKLTKLDDDKLRINYKSDTIEFSKFSDLLIDNDDSIKNTKKEFLNYKKRIGKCHSKSMEFINVGNYLVTGYVDDSSSKSRIVHSWIETEKYVIDYTSNLVIKKEDYYRLMNVEVLSVINKKDAFNDFNSDFLKVFSSVKFYCLFRDELDKEGLIQFRQDQLIKKL